MREGLLSLSSSSSSAKKPEKATQKSSLNDLCTTQFTENVDAYGAVVVVVLDSAPCPLEVLSIRALEANC